MARRLRGARRGPGAARAHRADRRRAGDRPGGTLSALPSPDADADAGSGAERFAGLAFDLALAAATALLFEPTIALAGAWPATTLCVTVALGMAAGGMTLGASMRGAPLPDLGGLEGLLLVLTPAAGLMLPMVYAAMAPSGLLPAAVWALPLPALFCTIAAGATVASVGDGPLRGTEVWLRSAAAFGWLFLGEALVFAFQRAGADPEASHVALFFFTLFWLPARALAGAPGASRWELLTAVGAYGWFAWTVLTAA